MSVYEQKLKVGPGDCTEYLTLRPSALLRMMTDAALEHYEEIGAGKQTTFDRGMLWVIVNNHVRINRMPKCGEKIVLQTWPGKTALVLYPRYFRILDATGEEIVTASTRWTIMNSVTRSFAFPKESGVTVQEELTGRELPPPTPIKRLPTTNFREITVPWCFVDGNGHLSNMHYLDLAENVLPEAQAGKKLKEISIEYSSEIPAGKTFTLSWCAEENRRFFSGDAEKHFFRMNLVYDE